MQVVCRIEGVDREGEICSYERKDIRSQYRATDLGGLILTEVSFLLKPADPERIRQRYREIIDERGSTQPLGFSAGCIFRNPSRSKPAGKLIESCGLKGHRIGGAHISTKHANFIINDGSATSSDILALIELVQQRVYQEFGIELRLEIEVW
jgi:UDP-N-acetylmuramate dehydrogenase